MRVLKHCAVLVSLAIAALGVTTVNATIVAQMNLEQLVTRSDRVFVGTVVSVSESRVAVGGGEVPAVTYRLHVSEAFKGQFDEVKGEQFTEVTMLGSLKHLASGRHPISDFPMLGVNEEYLLFVAPAGPVGITAPMGLGQGCFTLSGSPDDKVALNFVGNTGLFNGMSVGIAGGAPVAYSELAELIRAIVGGAQ